MVLAGTWLEPSIVRAQSSSLIEVARVYTLPPVAPVPVCAESTADKDVKAALRGVCLRQPHLKPALTSQEAIVIGFVGGFVGPNNTKHPEVQFAEYLRQVYPSVLHAEVFANHDGDNALRRVSQLLDFNGDGVLSPTEKEEANIIIYGHSWGGSQAITLARELERRNIPVSLTIQVDSVHKPGHKDGVIPTNVRSAVNFYQAKSLIHGHSPIRAADPERTRIIGNFEMKYEDRSINCDNYPWVARHFNRGHHEIENDPRVWEQIASLIDAELSKSTSALEASLPPASTVLLK